MTRTSILTKSVLAAIVAALAVATGTAAADDGPGFTAGTGCSVQCVKQAIVTPTASSAKVQIQTTVTAYVTVSVSKKSSGGTTGSFTTSQEKVVRFAVPAGHMRTAWFSDLEPDTEYTIGVTARDSQGQSSRKIGTFQTLPVQTSVTGGPSTLDSGLGCSAKCITKVLFKQAPPDGTAATIEVETSTEAKIKIAVAHDPEFFELVTSQSSSGFARSWKLHVSGLFPGTSYSVRVRATDREGGVSDSEWLFDTVRATALVTIQKLKIIADGDKGSAKGELFFRYFFGGTELAEYGFLKLRSGDVISARTTSTSRPGVSYRFPVIGDSGFHVGVSAEECDGVIFKNCRVEASGSTFFGDVFLTGQHTKVGGTFRLSDILSGALPGWFGTGVTQPAGHDGYFIFGPANDYVKIQALATVDIDYEWPS